jgi:uncharacterized membrane protein
MNFKNKETHSIFAQVIKKYVKHKYKLYKKEFNNDNIICFKSNFVDVTYNT